MCHLMLVKEVINGNASARGHLQRIRSAIRNHSGNCGSLQSFGSKGGSGKDSAVQCKGHC
jgi:hypothetical protein